MHSRFERSKNNGEKGGEKTPLLDNGRKPNEVEHEQRSERRSARKLTKPPKGENRPFTYQRINDNTSSKPSGDASSTHSYDTLKDDASSTHSYDTLKGDALSMRSYNTLKGDASSMLFKDSDSIRSTDSDRSGREVQGNVRDIREVRDKEVYQNLGKPEIAKREKMQTELSGLVQRADQYVGHSNLLGNTEMDRVETGKVIEKTINSIDVTRFATEAELREHVSQKIQENTSLSDTTRRKAAKIIEKTQQITTRDELLTRLERVTKEMDGRTDVDKGKNGARVQKFTERIREQIDKDFRASKLKDADIFLRDVQTALDRNAQKTNFSSIFSKKSDRVKQREGKLDFIDKTITSLQEELIKPSTQNELNKRAAIAKVERLQTIWMQSLLKNKTTHTIDAYIPSQIPIDVKSVVPGAEKNAIRYMNNASELSHVQERLQRMDSDAFEGNKWKEALHERGGVEQNMVDRIGQASDNLDMRDELITLSNRNRPYEQQPTPSSQRQEKTIVQFQDALDSVLMRPKDNTSTTQLDKSEVIEQVREKMNKSLEKKTFGKFIKTSTRERKIRYINNLATEMKDELGTGHAE